MVVMSLSLRDGRIPGRQYPDECWIAAARNSSRTAMIDKPQSEVWLFLAKSPMA